MANQVNLKRLVPVLECLLKLKAGISESGVYLDLHSESSDEKTATKGGETTSSKKGIFIGDKPAVNNVAHDLASCFPTLETGRILHTPGLKRQLRILEIAGYGHRAKVYKTEDCQSGELFALKIIHDANEVNVSSIAKDLVKTNTLKENHLPHTEVIEEGKDFALKQWLDGRRGDHWMNVWVENGLATSDIHFQSLMAFYCCCATKGVHVDNLKPANMMLTKEGIWNPFDPGVITEGLKADEVLRRYADMFIRRWIYISKCPTPLLLYWTIRKMFL